MSWSIRIRGELYDFPDKVTVNIGRDENSDLKLQVIISLFFLLNILCWIVHRLFILLYVECLWIVWCTI